LGAVTAAGGAGAFASMFIGWAGGEDADAEEGGAADS
jgi:hypothetical protein